MLFVLQLYLQEAQHVGLHLAGALVPVVPQDGVQGEHGQSVQYGLDAGQRVEVRHVQLTGEILI